MTSQEIFDSAYKLIKLLKPEFYNKITWAIVVAGLAILSTSLIDKLINAVFKISFNIEITDGNDAVVGLALVVIGLVYHLLSRKIEIQESNSTKREQDAKRSEHDIEVFNRTNEIMGETTLKDILDWIGTDHSYESDQKSIIDRFFHEAREHNNSYLHAEIEVKKQDFIISLGKLRSFLSLNFFVYPKEQVKIRRFCLYPELNMDRGGFPTPEQSQRYDEKAEEMFALIDSAYENYVNYRLSVKQWLYV